MALRLIAAVAALLAAASVATAQTATLSGTVLDESGAGLPGATVTLSGPGGRQTAVTDSAGAYRFRDVAPGTYQVAVTISAFAPASRDGIVVGGGDATVPAIAVALAPLSETVTVSASKVESRLIDAP